MAVAVLPGFRRKRPRPDRQDQERLQPQVSGHREGHGGRRRVEVNRGNHQQSGLQVRDGLPPAGLFSFIFGKITLPYDSP